MCIQDVRIGRDSFTAAYVKDAADATDTPFLAAAADRTHITFGVSGVPGYVFPASGFTGSGRGYILDPANRPVEFDIRTHGDIVTKAWFASGSGGTANIAVVETFFKDKGY